jgi:uncharacterized protein YpmB
MTNRKKSYKITSIAMILFLIFVSSAASAYSEQSASPAITETQITANRSASSPVIFGDKMVYFTFRPQSKIKHNLFF